MIKIYKKIINNKKVEIQCDDTLKRFIDSFFDLLDKQEKEHSIIEDNNIVEIGWSFYFIKKYGDNVYSISCPDYDKNPFKDRSRDLTKSFNIQAIQNKLLHETKRKGSPVTFQDTIMVLKDAMEFKDVYMHRVSETENKDSGWHIGVLDDPKEKHPVEDYTKMHSYELLKYNPELIKVLPLDVGCVVIIKDGKIAEIVDKDDNKIF